MREPTARRGKLQLTADEREEISRGLAANQSARAIARRLKRPGSSVSREIARHGGREHYRAHDADKAARQRRRRPKRTKLSRHRQLRLQVESKLQQRWSPQQIAGWLRATFVSDSQMRVSHETIYRSLFDPRRRALNRELTRQLRTGRPMRYPRTTRSPTGQGKIRDMMPISQRPAEVDDRVVPGHWEGDLVMGKRPSAIATLVERTSRYVLLVALPDGIKSAEVRPHLTHAVLDAPAALRRSLTWDRGREMAEHRTFSTDTAMPVYFCKRGHPWQRGSNENVNRLLRQYLAKSADLRKFTQDDLNRIAAELNSRPRAIHGFRTPVDLYTQARQAVMH